MLARGGSGLNETRLVENYDLLFVMYRTYMNVVLESARAGVTSLLSRTNTVMLVQSLLRPKSPKVMIVLQCWLFPRLRGFLENVRPFIPCLRFSFILYRNITQHNTLFIPAGN